VRRGRPIAVLLSVALLGVASSVPAEAQDRIAVVVGVSSDVRRVDVDVLREIYLRRQRVWPSGRRVMPVNLPPDHPLRDAFSRRVLGQETRDLVGYWNRRYLDGVQPPLVLKSARAVCAYVAVEPDAIGYVPAGEVDPAACRVLLALPGPEQ
jgi:hypothetical protein